MYLLTANYSVGFSYSATGSFSTFYYSFTSSSAFLGFFFFFFFSPYYLGASCWVPNSFSKASSYSFSCCFLLFFCFFWLLSTYSTGCSGAGSATGVVYSSCFSSSLSDDSWLPKAKGFLTVSRWNFFFSNFSALNPPLTVLRCAKSPPLNFFLASKGTILASLFLLSYLVSLISLV